MAMLRCAIAAAAVYVGPIAAMRTHIETVPNAPPAAGQDGVEAEVGDYNLRISNKSGKFRIFNKVKGEGKSGIEVEMDALREIDVMGNVVGKSETEKHSIETFAGQDFKIHPAVSDFTFGVETLRVTFESTIAAVGHLAVDTYIVKKAGEMGPPGEKWAVHPGDLKWNITVDQWTWCSVSANNCHNKEGKAVEGAALELRIKVKRTSGKKMHCKKGNETLQPAQDAADVETLQLSKQVAVDGVWIEMPAGFPQVTDDGASTVFTFRFPKFDSKIVYDPLISESGDTGLRSSAPRAILGLTTPLMVTAAWLFGRT